MDFSLPGTKVHKNEKAWIRNCTLARGVSRANVEFDVRTWSSTCERETPRAHVDMVNVRTWSFTFAREV